MVIFFLEILSESHAAFMVVLNSVSQELLVFCFVLFLQVGLVVLGLHPIALMDHSGAVGGRYEMPEIESVLVVCKSSALPALQSNLSGFKNCFFFFFLLQS